MDPPSSPPRADIQREPAVAAAGFAVRPAVAIVANPISGRGKARRWAAELERELAQAGVPVRLLFTERSGDAARLAGELGDDVGRVVAVGGDGTLSEVVSGLRDPGIAVGMLPTGTANVLAKELGLPRDPAGCARVVAAGCTVPFDVGEANGRRFLMVAGVGFDAHCARAVNLGRKTTIRMSTYIGPVARAMFTFEHPRLTVTFKDDDGRVLEAHEDVLSLVVSNVRSYGGPFELASYAHHASGRFDALLFRGRFPLVAFGQIMAAALLRMAPLLSRVTYRACRQLTVEAPRPVPYQLDGDHAGETPVTFTMLPSKVAILAPAGTP